MGRPRFSRAERETVLNLTEGKCYHCGTDLAPNFHVDHHPVPFRDIEGNCLCCGVTDARDIQNLKPSCVKCNTSHQFEPRGVFCGHTQPYVPITAVYKIILLLSHGLCFGAGFLISKSELL